MASLRDLKRRILSVKSTRKITKAMKMIAAVRLRKAQEAIESARPYAVKLHEALSNLALRIEGKKPPLLQQKDKEIKKVELLVITSDRGLCGGFNSNILRYAERYRKEKVKDFKCSICIIGRKGWEYFQARGVPVRKQYLGVFDDLSYENSQKISEEIINEYLNETFDRVDLIYNEFKSAVSQQVVHETLLPVQPLDVDSLQNHGLTFVQSDYDYEPNKEDLLESILPRYFATQIYRAFLESIASEHGARMTAMENATNNATDMIDSLTLQFNRARQAAITTELMEIIGGAEALKA